MFLIHSLFFLVVLSSSCVLATNNNRKEDRLTRSDREGLWFGPRLGKRSLHLPDEDNRDVYYRLIEAADALRYYYNQLPESYLERRDDPESRVTKKVIFTPKLGRSLNERNFADFTPRLGRRVADAEPVTPTDQDSYEVDRIGARTRYFSPRLGRNMNFSPRLGRELSYDNYDNEKVRVARSTNDTKVSER